ncbi:hypothetical protein [Schlesneria paludicola]|uniref:hypothetical protein n=1 Tax=Schlesneria paludicola TaxID=360056 RepID=UPI00029AD580|nr:hypothetical protein [Schlesneria paludicola]
MTKVEFQFQVKIPSGPDVARRSVELSEVPVVGDCVEILKNELAHVVERTFLLNGVVRVKLDEREDCNASQTAMLREAGWKFIADN